MPSKNGNEAPRAETLSAYILVFESLGYEVCQDGDLEYGFEKVALFSQLGVPTHAARQLPSGVWTSKLGRIEDITHHLEALGGDSYGSVECVMRRPSAY